MPRAAIVEHEASEFAVAVEQHLADLAINAPASVRAQGAAAATAVHRSVRWHGARVAADSVDAVGDVFDVMDQQRMASGWTGASVRAAILGRGATFAAMSFSSIQSAGPVDVSLVGGDPLYEYR